MDPTKKRWMSRVGIVVIAALMVEMISIFQYWRVRRLMEEDMSIRSHIVMRALSNEIEHVLELTETTMKENVWDLQRNLDHPDSNYSALVRLIDDNPMIEGGCLAFVPYYYPSKGRIYEPYVSKTDEGMVKEQLASEDHDYTLNKAYQTVLETGLPIWSDPYYYGPDSLGYTTYSYPIKDTKGRMAAVCGIDLNLSWLGDTLNARQPFQTSFALLLTQEGNLVAAPDEGRATEVQVDQVVDILNGTLPASVNPAITIRKIDMSREPYWQLVQVYQAKEVYARVRRMRMQNMLLILLGVAILAFMISRYARNEKKLRAATEAQARMDGELAAAKSIQQEMIPTSFPPYVYGTLEPAREVGGDMFDFFRRDGKLFFCIGDVSGKGVPAAMLMSMVHSLFRMVSMKEESPAHILHTLNQHLCRGNDSNMFITFFVGCLDLYTGVLDFGNAGHDKPFLLTDEPVLLKTMSNLPLGVFPDTRFEEQRCTLSPGTILLLYTDGLTEAKNVERKALGRERVTEVLNTFLTEDREGPLEKLIVSLSEAAHRFAGEEPQSDDLTMLSIRFAPGDMIREELMLSCDEAEIPRLGDFAKGFLGRLDLDKKTASNLRLALEEAVVNVIQYAYPNEEKGSILVQADSDRTEVRFTLIDSGTPFDPTSVLEADTTLDAHNRPIGGLGILLSRRMTDSVAYSRRDGQNVLTLTKSIV